MVQLCPLVITNDKRFQNHLYPPSCGTLLRFKSLTPLKISIQMSVGSCVTFEPLLRTHVEGFMKTSSLVTSSRHGPPLIQVENILCLTPEAYDLPKIVIFKLHRVSAHHLCIHGNNFFKMQNGSLHRLILFPNTLYVLRCYGCRCTKLYGRHFVCSLWIWSKNIRSAFYGQLNFI